MEREPWTLQVPTYVQCVERSTSITTATRHTSGLTENQKPWWETLYPLLLTVASVTPVISVARSINTTAAFRSIVTCTLLMKLGAMSVSFVGSSISISTRTRNTLLSTLQ
ncbi:unnamed protein product [Tetraodon nigroviridis]|uniref:(spotted green pufferfish) hypothetical protein n=1 Tax=Tetraodon nigroviridis TaxID=99883 RepID=Q4RGR4_TETNG|nr:unnamed protein product [Tetraodon nigroviridis]